MRQQEIAMTVAGPGRCAATWTRGAGLGLLLGWAAWGEDRAPVLVLLLPFLVATRASRAEAALAAGGYAIGLLRSHVEFVAGWFGDDVWAGAGVVLACGCTTAAAWSFGWSGAASGRTRAMRMFFAWLIALLPPAALATPGHPLVAVGYLLSGSGWLGVIGSALLAAAAGWVGSVRCDFVVGPFMLAAAGALGGLSLFVENLAATRPIPGIVGVTTHWGLLRGTADALERMQRMGARDQGHGASVVVWPESIIGRYEPAMQPVLELELLKASWRKGQTQVIGLDLELAGERLVSTAVAFRPDGTIRTATARQPAPLALWRPWQSRRSFVADWGATNILALNGGIRAAVIFCFEEYVPILSLLNELLDRPTVYLAVANTWSAGSNAVAIQTAHSIGMARLFDRPYVRSDNRSLH